MSIVHQQHNLYVQSKVDYNGKSTTGTIKAHYVSEVSGWILTFGSCDRY